jgi:hypothetical protein
MKTGPKLTLVSQHFGAQTLSWLSIRYRVFAMPHTTFTSRLFREGNLATTMDARSTTNLIVIAHGIYQDLPDGTTKIFPQGVGQKLSPKIPQYFPNYIRYKNVGGKRIMQLVSDPMIDLANTRPDAFKEKTLPIETGLAEFFAALRGQPAKPEEAPAPRPSSLTLRRVNK